MDVVLFNPENDLFFVSPRSWSETPIKALKFPTFDSALDYRQHHHLNFCEIRELDGDIALRVLAFRTEPTPPALLMERPAFSRN